MSGVDGIAAYQEVMGLLDEVDAHVEKMRAAGCQFAKNERDYREAVAVETLRLIADGMAATAARDVVRGMERVAGLKCAMTCAEANRDAEREALNSKKLRARILSAQIDRDWALAERRV
ncbi:hypothetical protein GMI70_02950 [Eggerthellaceae bacterium zg-893]|nr:hypothetical protein [Eggerthellaceae bacterium zg-893]